MKLEIGTKDNSELSCPSCGFEYGLHIDKVTCYGGTSDDYFSNGSIEITDTFNVKFRPDVIDADHRCRELSFHINVWCEDCGKESNIRFGFHKGLVLVKSEVIGDRKVE